MNKSILLSELYQASLNNDADRSQIIINRLLRKGVSFRIINKVLILSNVSKDIEDVYLTMRGLLMDSETLYFA